jgi:predicted P-loop ATPase/GTPase
LGIECAQDITADTAKTIDRDSKSVIVSAAVVLLLELQDYSQKIENKPF